MDPAKIFSGNKRDLILVQIATWLASLAEGWYK